MQCFWLSFANLLIKDLKYNFIESSQYLIILFRVNKVITFYRNIYVKYLNDYYWSMHLNFLLWFAFCFSVLTVLP